MDKYGNFAKQQVESVIFFINVLTFIVFFFCAIGLLIQLGALMEEEISGWMFLVSLAYGFSALLTFLVIRGTLRAILFYISSRAVATYKTGSAD